MVTAAFSFGTGQGSVQLLAATQSPQRDSKAIIERMQRRVTPAQREAAALAIPRRGALVQGKSANQVNAQGMNMPMPGATPDYFGIPNWTNSPMPTVDPTTGAISGGIRKFVDKLPGLRATNANNLGQFIPVAVPDTATYQGSDYYEIGLVEYAQKAHSDLPPTKLRGYVQLNDPANPATRDANGKIIAWPQPHYLGPLIVAQRDRPVRVKFTNLLPTDSGGDLFIPVDTTVMGAGMGPYGMTPPVGDMNYTQNRGTLHLHGGHTPWISDGTPHQWVTPAGETTSYPKGVSTQDVPDMPDSGDGSMTFFYTNQQSARLMFYHDHSYGITRLNVYAGEAAGYVISDQTEQTLINGGTIGAVTVNPGTVPAEQIPLIIQDKTFVPDPATLAATDPMWDMAKWGGFGNLWFPHVYMPNQNPYDDSGTNPYGRWDYGPWFWPPLTPAAGLKHGEVANPYYDPVHAPWEPPMIPGTPNVSMVMEAFMDTPVVNGAAYPFLPVERKAYRFRILNACNDRFLNLQLYYAKSNTPDAIDPATGLPTLQTDSGEVPMVPAVKTAGYPVTWPTDGRDGGVPNPAAIGPELIQIGTEGGFLPAPAEIPSQPIGYNYNRRDIVVLNVSDHALFMGPAERADVVIDFSQVPDGSKLILYNDSPAPVPGFDPRLDYYTGNPDMTSTGGAPTTIAGYGPNIRTIMQFQVSGPQAPQFDLAALKAALPAAFAASQPPIIVPQAAYGPVYGTTFPNAYSRIQSTSLTFTPLGSIIPLTIQMQSKAIQELFELDYGRMNSTLGVELPLTNFLTQTTIPLGYIDPATETIDDSVTPMAPAAGDGTQIWKVTHNGVDTHAMHFHLFDVQLVNRVGWDGAIRPPDANELGWKDTVRMNPLEDAIVALRPTAPELPFGVPDSIRLLNPTMPIGDTTGFTNVDPATGKPITVTNQVTNFGWEYVWHCHLLGHEEMDMMRPVIFNVARQLPAAPVLNAVEGVAGVDLTWTDATPANSPSTWGNPANEIGFRIERADGLITTFTMIGKALANSTAYTDSTAAPTGFYTYRVAAYNAAGDSMSNAVSVGPLPAPTGLAASAIGPNRIDLTWTALNSTQTGFRIERAVGAGAFSAVGTAPADATTYSDTTAADGTTYTYRLFAFNSSGDSLPSNTASATTPLAPPSSLAAAISAAPPLAVNLRWTNNSTAATGFIIQRARNASFTLELTTFTVAGTTPAYSNTNALANTTYYYRVAATLGTMTSAWSGTASITTVPPAAPTGLTATAAPLSANPPTVALAWKANPANLGSFTIQRATNPSFLLGLTTIIVGASPTAYTDASVQLNTRYYYRVRATNGAGNSAWSSFATAITAGQLPLGPTNLTALAIGTNYVILGWTDNSSNEQGFYVDRSTNGGITWTQVVQTTANTVSFRNNRLAGKTTYLYRVQAFNASGVSTFSNTLSVTTL